MRRRIGATLLGIVSFGCAAGDTTPRASNSAAHASALADTAAVQQAALTELFLVRERASALLLWDDTAHTGPVFDSLGLSAAHKVSVPAALAVARVGLRALDALFARHPDGWAALYATYPGTPGLVEVGQAVFDNDGRSAHLTVGRSCGENCRMAWRVTLAPQDDTAWRVREIAPVPAR